MERSAAQERRKAVEQMLEEAGGPVSATALARRFSVSRQIIVGDVALLRAAGADIVATPRGYVLGRRPAGVERTVACVHAPEEMEAELNAIVDAGGEVADVIVEHPVYGQLTGILGVRSRYDVQEFLQRVRADDARPLSDLTGGIHLHTIRCKDEKTFQRIQKTLKKAGFLLDM
ncbi:transcription repressor NadR [Flavonifractor sp. An91]|uniref:transcription repressor NadR n=1 Tax=Flavonifractor sp. An91 TaxID=1965665 RepID=UPI000B39D5BE|nr:transcription repressor NadR [Flavonifractor sp. An91]OUN10408.1 transcription repressor NadR [Flavonifractor sp. An91]